MAANNRYLGITMAQAHDMNPENATAQANSNARPAAGTAADIEVRIQTDPGTGANNIKRKDVILGLQKIIQYIESGGSAHGGANVPAP